KIILFFVQTLVILIPFAKSNEYLSWLEAFNFEMPFIKQISGSDSFLGCPFPARAYTKFLMDFIKPLVMFIAFIFFFILAIIIHFITSCRQMKYEDNNTESIQILPKSDSSDFKYKMGFTKKVVHKIASKATGLISLLFKIFFNPQSYSLSFVNLLIATYGFFAELGFKYVSCLKVGDTYHVISDTQ